MNDILNKTIAWIKGNLILSIIGLLVAVFLFFPKLLGVARRRRRKYYQAGRRVSRRTYSGRRRRSLPRSAGRRKRSYTKGGKAKKAWQIKGSEAARRHMARLRRMRA